MSGVAGAAWRLRDIVLAALLMTVTAQVVSKAKSQRTIRKSESTRSTGDQSRRIMIPHEIAREAWSLATRHLARGERHPTMMIGQAISLDRQRCSKVEFCCASSEVVSEIRARKRRKGPEFPQGDPGSSARAFNFYRRLKSAPFPRGMQPIDCNCAPRRGPLGLLVAEIRSTVHRDCAGVRHSQRLTYDTKEL